MTRTCLRSSVQGSLPALLNFANYFMLQKPGAAQPSAGQISGSPTKQNSPAFSGRDDIAMALFVT